MAMTKHIAAFDPLIMSMVHARRGNAVKAAQLFAQAVTSPDAVLAIKTLEQNNQKAFAIQASARAEEAKKLAASKKQTASKKSKKETASKVVADEFEIEGDEPMMEDDGMEDDDVHVDVNIDGDDEEEEDEEEGDGTFEATLASFLKKGKSGK